LIDKNNHKLETYGFLGDFKEIPEEFNKVL